MKKKIFGSIAVLVIAVVAAWNVNFNSQKSTLSDISLSNVEALATGEVIPGPACTYSYSDYCTNGDVYILNVKRS